MYKYANSRSLQGLQRAELSGTLIQKQTQGGSSTYVLHRPGRAQEDHQLLREESERRDSFGRRRECHADRAGRVVAHAAAALDRRVGSDAVHQLDLRSLETVRRRAEGGASGDAAGHRRIEKEKRPSRRAQDRRSAALRSAAGMLHGAERVSRAAPRPALSKPSGEAGRADEEQTGWPVDGDRRELQQGKTSSEALFRRAAARFPRSSGTHQTSDEGGTRNGRSSRPNRAVAAALPGTRSGSPCARRAFADDSRHWSGHRVDLGVGSRRGRPVFFSEKSGELLRLVQRADRIGGITKRAPISKQRNKHLQTVLIEAAKIAPIWNADLALVHEKALQKGNRNRATLAVARKLVGYLLAVDRRETPFRKGQESAAAA